jgi:translation initiation factor IF-2
MSACMAGMFINFEKEEMTMGVSVTKLIRHGKLKRGRYIVYDNHTMKVLSGIRGQTKSTAYRIRRAIMKKRRR